MPGINAEDYAKVQHAQVRAQVKECVQDVNRPALVKNQKKKSQGRESLHERHMARPL